MIFGQHKIFSHHMIIDIATHSIELRSIDVDDHVMIMDGDDHHRDQHEQ